MEEKEIDINNENEILDKFDFDYCYNSEKCSRELCMFYNDISMDNRKALDKRQAFIDLGRIAITLNRQDKHIKDLEKEIQQLNEELDKYKETVQELQETSSKMFDKLLKNHLCKFQKNPYNEENQEFKNDIKLLISVVDQIKELKGE